MSQEVKEIRSLTKEEFRRLFEKYYIELVYVASLKINDQNIAIELVNELFINLQDRIDQYNPKKATIRSWLLVCLKNLIIDYKKRDDIHNEMFCEINNDLENELTQTPNYDSFKISDLESILTNEEYQYIILDYVLDLKKQEISNHMKISDSTRKRLKKSSLSKIKKYIKEGNIKWEEKR